MRHRTKSTGQLKLARHQLPSGLRRHSSLGQLNSLSVCSSFALALSSNQPTGSAPRAPAQLASSAVVASAPTPRDRKATQLGCRGNRLAMFRIPPEPLQITIALSVHRKRRRGRRCARAPVHEAQVYEPNRAVVFTSHSRLAVICAAQSKMSTAACKRPDIDIYIARTLLGRLMSRRGADAAGDSRAARCSVHRSVRRSSDQRAPPFGPQIRFHWAPSTWLGSPGAAHLRCG